MALFKFTHFNKHGNLRTRILHRPTTQFTISNPKSYGNMVSVQIFKYKHTHPHLPFAFINANGKKYMLPDWIEVHPETTADDVIWEKTKIDEPKQKSNSWEFESKSDPGHFYKVTFNGLNYKCNCPGVWRSKDRICKHIKEVKSYE